MAVYGYARVSTKEQHEDRQILELKKAGLEDRYIYIDKISGKSFNRPSYNLLVGTESSAPLLREGDTLLITSLDRMGRNYSEIQTEWRHLTNDLKVDVKILDMPLLDTTGSGVAATLDRRFISDLVLQILSYVAEKERLNIKRNQRAGIEAAKKAGKRLGRPRIDYPEIWPDVYKRWQNGEITARRAMQESGVEDASFYNLAKRYESENGIKRKRYHNFRLEEE